MMSKLENAMNDLIVKIKYITPRYFLVVLLSTLILVSLRCLLVYQFHFLKFERKIWELLLPFVIALVSVFIFLTAKLTAFRFKYYGLVNGSYTYLGTTFLLSAICVFSIFVTGSIAELIFTNFITKNTFEVTFSAIFLVVLANSFSLLMMLSAAFNDFHSKNEKEKVEEFVSKVLRLRFKKSQNEIH